MQIFLSLYIFIFLSYYSLAPCANFLSLYIFIFLSYYSLAPCVNFLSLYIFIFLSNYILAPCAQNTFISCRQSPSSPSGPVTTTDIIGIIIINKVITLESYQLVPLKQASPHRGKSLPEPTFNIHHFINASFQLFAHLCQHQHHH